MPSLSPLKSLARNLMFYKDWLSFTKLFGCLQFVNYIIFYSKWLNLFFKDLKQQNLISVWRCLGFDCQPTTEVSRCRSFSNANLFWKKTAVAVELSRDLMWLALLGGWGGILHIMDYTGRLRQKGIPFWEFRYRKGQGFHKLKHMKGLTGVVYGCKKSKPMVLYEQYLKVMQR